MKKAILSLLLLIGCSGLEKRDCAGLDWYKQGEIDGNNGKRRSYFLQHGLACKLTPDRATYLKGREEGLKQFCTYSGGFRDALEGQIYLGQCIDSKNIKNFKKGREKGSEIYFQKEKIFTLKEKLKDIKRDFKHDFSSSDEMLEYNNDIGILKNEIKIEEAHLNKLLRSNKMKY